MAGEQCNPKFVDIDPYTVRRAEKAMMSPSGSLGEWKTELNAPGDPAHRSQMWECYVMIL